MYRIGIERSSYVGLSKCVLSAQFYEIAALDVLSEKVEGLNFDSDECNATTVSDRRLPILRSIA